MLDSLLCRRSRRAAWNEARKAARANEPGYERRPGPRHAPTAPWPLGEELPVRAVENPENLIDKQQAKPAWIVQTDPRLGRAYYLKEGLRLVFKLPFEEAAEALDRWSENEVTSVRSARGGLPVWRAGATGGSLELGVGRQGSG